MKKLIWGMIIFASLSSFANSKTFTYDFSAGESDYGFEGLFRDIPNTQYENYMNIKAAGGDLGPVPPDTINMLATQAEASHWFMNAGIHKVPDVEGEVYGYLLQGVNRSDDMDKYMVKKFGPQEGLLPNTDYEIVVLEADIAANDRIGAYGPGGAEARNLDVVLMNKDPYPYVVDSNNHVRFSDGNSPLNKDLSQDGLSGTGVCQIKGTFGLIPGFPMCPPSGRIPYVIVDRPKPTKKLHVKTDDQGFFWLLLGGHSGHESLDEFFMIKLVLSIDGEFAN
ncbi:MAG: hypothetical protein A2381_16285 [Bdellovibrionales bacterium RIFOXYB1_FULL_37_110]|nr:MAG: hypothetical protein A2181_06390 [Bdellovibrionales bacterium RIFOXYA1_FULL_38_20]OFZ48500.1 MAG: hypothetical protein A2417_04145 [Bdellovibrionales bacterium RIFOXYC1_FULL_37_79]OFZ57179.1 MAG: hypothetical protein A2381_16285 [Bdellovibrionales bacterium RIFOXYB1_FULL_37_110]OFZ63158.1 MAG: hypothetical protein A2577_15785 [Bdellovibrionales bacterium RIFOXYD1_FULL_36_51]